MRLSSGHFFLFAFLSASVGYGDSTDNAVQTKPLSTSAYMDFGQIESGRGGPTDASLPNVDLKGKFIQRSAVWLTQEASVGKNLKFTIGAGGTIWYSIVSKQGTPSTALPEFGPGISQAQAVYKFGDVENPIATLQMGIFPYKYNPEAENLGEYLLRSGTYPGYLVSGGWNMISSAAYMVNGLRLNVSLWDGKFQSDFLLPMEHDMPPMYDLSPTYVATLTPVKGLELGAGVDWNHAIAIKPSKEALHNVQNMVILSATPNPVSAVENGGGGVTPLNMVYDSTQYYTFQGLKVMGRVAIDPKAYMGENSVLGPQDLKLYGEIAVLGWKDYSYLYSDRAQRMPIMVGFNLPAFHLLDVFSVEVEYYNSKFLNDIFHPLNDAIPVWETENDAIAGYQTVTGSDSAGIAKAINNYNSALSQQKWKWSVYAKKEITKGLRLYAQVANDHLRPLYYNAGAQPLTEPATILSKDWYYLVRLEFGI